GASYWNGAILDPLQHRGFPDYVTQMRGARRLLAGELPYDPKLRAWVDVNLPPITLLWLFAPFAALSELRGRLAYFALNHVAFIAAVGLLLRNVRPPAAVISPLLWTSLVVAVAAAFEPWHDSLRLGQQNGVVFFFLAVSAIAIAAGRDVLAGAALAAALIGKPSAALVGVYFLLARRWRAATSAAATGLAAFLITLPWTGIENWRFYLAEKAPQLLAGTPQQSNVALLAFHARLFLPLESLASFDAMPEVPLAQALTRASQLIGVFVFWRLVSRHGRASGGTTSYLELCVALVLSIALVGHAWQSYTTWLIIAFVPLADPRLWAPLAPRLRAPLAAAAGLCYAGLAINDVSLHRVVGSTSLLAAVFAALPTFALLLYAYLLALLTVARDREMGGLSHSPVSAPSLTPV
ncbi:MAG TPA: glycosyltransferase family 87 protein, partial [Chloroflexota bacterium]|nr:glycosyltransferase family 87 protein [Chloroflexota bacterium]